jgi:hypothetical protein
MMILMMIEIYHSNDISDFRFVTLTFLCWGILMHHNSLPKGEQ